MPHRPGARRVDRMTTSTRSDGPATGPAPDVPPDRSRIAALDVLRGIAVCGILLVNIGPVTRFGTELEPAAATLSDASGWLQLFVQQRFFPVFSVLFGVGSALFLRSAARRPGARPRVLLLRRLLVLLPVGLLHQLGHPGEALTVYAVVGLLVLLPSTWLPRWAVATGAAVLVGLALQLAGGGLALVPGLLLLGAALVRFGLVDRLTSPGRWPVGLCAAASLAAVPAVAWQLQDLPGSGFDHASAVAGLLMATAYVTGVVALLGTRARPLLERAFVPLGRTALTTYLSATPVMLVLGRVADLPHRSSWTLVLTASVVLLVL